MCYDIKTSLEAQLKRARGNKDLKAIAESIEKLVPLTDLPLHHASGFSHPALLMYTNDDPYYPTVATWGLVPHWVKDNEQKQKLWNNTLNARGETIFDKPAFRDAALEKRCIIYVDGFYEHHHHKGKVYPFFIQPIKKEPLALAGLWSEWIDPDHGGKLLSFTIVTTVGNILMKRIHNNPKLKGPRMPLILMAEEESQWLEKREGMETHWNTRIKSYPEDFLQAHTVGKLRGRNYVGNVPSVSDMVCYKELEKRVLPF